MDSISLLGAYPENLIYLLIRFGINLVLIYIIVWRLYRPYNDDKTYIFTYFVFNVLIFFICYLMANTQLGLGFAFGLFALFSILRYRTTTIGIKEMTYLFSVVCIAIINALSRMSIAEWMIADLAILGIIYFLEKRLFSSTTKYTEYKIKFNQLALIHPDKQELLIQELKLQTGLEIEKVKIGNIDLIGGSVNLVVYVRDITNKDI